MMKHIYLTDNTNMNGVPSVKMVCDCAWEEKAFQRDALRRAETHIRTKHSTGMIHYKGQARQV